MPSLMYWNEEIRIPNRIGGMKVLMLGRLGRNLPFLVPDIAPG
jgi:hypothetical protein